MQGPSVPPGPPLPLAITPAPLVPVFHFDDFCTSKQLRINGAARKHGPLLFLTPGYAQVRCVALVVFSVYSTRRCRALLFI